MFVFITVTRDRLQDPGLVACVLHEYLLMLFSSDLWADWSVFHLPCWCHLGRAYSRDTLDDNIGITLKPAMQHHFFHYLMKNELFVLNILVLKCFGSAMLVWQHFSWVVVQLDSSACQLCLAQQAALAKKWRGWEKPMGKFWMMQ